MAYVRKTDTLVNDIISSVDRMSRDAKRVYEDAGLEHGTPLYDQFVKSFTDFTWKSAPQLQAQMPDEWCARKRTVTLYVNRGGVSEKYVHRFESGNNFKFKLSPEYADDSWPDISMELEDLTPQAQEWVASSTSRETKRREIQDQFTLIRTQLSTFMTQHASLNAALTDMPELEMYVPAKYMAKVAAKSEPRTKVQPRSVSEELNIDVDALAAAAITHRMTTANGAS